VDEKNDQIAHHTIVAGRRNPKELSPKQQFASHRKAIREFVAHYHLERNHQGLGNRLITPQAIPTDSNGTIQRRQRLGGMLNYYQRAA
jgi:hypothetical protein